MGMKRKSKKKKKANMRYFCNFNPKKSVKKKKPQPDAFVAGDRSDGRNIYIYDICVDVTLRCSEPSTGYLFFLLKQIHSNIKT